MRPQGRCIHLFGQEAAGGPANEEPVLQHRGFLTAPEYARAIRTSTVLGVFLAMLAAVSGCGGSSQAQSELPAAGTTTATAPASTSTGIDPLAGAGTTAVAAPATATDTALL